MNTQLIEAVKEQIGDTDYLQDVSNHGADAGYPGFTYYNDTCNFYDTNKTDILDLANIMGEELGEETLAQFVSGFNCLDLTPGEVEAFFMGFSDEWETQIKNALAWFALEEVARHEVEQ